MTPRFLYDDPAPDHDQDDDDCRCTECAEVAAWDEAERAADARRDE